MTTTHVNRYECRWREKAPGDGIAQHYWVDHDSTEPHWPPSAVMRWDLRPDDWDAIWPELIDHPCAWLFARRHPNRDGPPRFRDWVASWPPGFEWEASIPEHIHPAVKKALKELASPNDALPVDEPTMATQPLPATPIAEHVLDQLAVLLLDLEDDQRQSVAKDLGTLAMAPDSGRVLQALKLAFEK